jgi:dTDP-4-dehydrorhamnose reductase
MRILITGAKGRLGSQLTNLLEAHHEITAVDIEEMDFTQRDLVQETFSDLRPDLVLHCGALTNVDQCARQPDLAMQVNAFGTKSIALACQQFDATLLYISTNEVFDGNNTGTVHEYDAARPINAYGHSKWVGEQIIRDHLTRFYIVRTSWLFAHGGGNFVQKMIELAQNGGPLKVVVNEVAAPTYTSDLAEGIVALIETDAYGIYHLVNEGRASRWHFARSILDMIGCEEVLIEKITIAEFARPSTPPEYSVLGNNAAAALGIRLRPWQDALRAFLMAEGHLK